ncbi:GtrA family protein [Williamsia maris]|uniref:Flippase GtrA (Transmembrane translocase of bactoprenol-linked glucose) n=2 Tax=Williamsia maris TaxID=72806 RepID=A0ABT1HC16_9NOCA|nr:putative flippase GtrA (transmembrane translocase of bactoprenol-linked glucose) [Williamsia maris]
MSDDQLAPGEHHSHEEFRTPHAPMPIELPLDDAEASTDVDLKTQLVRFVITGAGSGVLDFGITLLLQYVIGAPYWLAKTVGFIAGTTTAYLINRRWTFRAEPSRARFIAVIALYLVTFAVQVGIYSALSHVWPEEILYSLFAYVIAQGTATVINFAVQRIVIFKIG